MLTSRHSPGGEVSMANCFPHSVLGGASWASCTNAARRHCVGSLHDKTCREAGWFGCIIADRRYTAKVSRKVSGVIRISHHTGGHVCQIVVSGLGKNR